MAYPNYYVPNMTVSTSQLMPNLDAKTIADRNIQPMATPKNPVDIAGVAQAGIGAIGLVANATNMANQRLNIDESAPPLEYSATGKPVYNSAFYLQAKHAKVDKTSFGEALNGAVTGAGAGAAFGAPGIAIGAAAGLMTSLIGGGIRRRQQAAQKRRAVTSAMNQQRSFNTASEQFDQQQAAQQDYIRRRNMTNRLYNLYQPTV